ncbi:hypothetical protein C8A03DRAFT_17916 [Achaetomium macrosporum]|uniref:Myb-like domain-containing protein n=1 Tax=Achaetomium macrosporum TaxID=79813 RepID=A0AAN7C5X1_9PEZI|nr:hypothetical protein C8A03DRAFT_17916 [Achaetomium macrosporum]
MTRTRGPPRRPSRDTNVGQRSGGVSAGPRQHANATPENGVYGLTAAQQASTTSGTGPVRYPPPPGVSTLPPASNHSAPAASITAPIENLGIDDDDAPDDHDAAPAQVPYLVGDETATLAEYPYSIYNHGTWTAEEDKTLIQARSRGQNWAELQRTHFPTKTANACRKRYERLVERRGIYDYSGRRLEMVANEYMNMRKEIWSGLADRLGMKWDAVEALCMGVGLRSIQSNARSYTNRARRETRISRKTRESQAEAVSLDPLKESRLLAQFDSLVEQGLVVYHGDYRTVVASDNGFPFEFRILDSLKNKPQTPRDPEKRASPEQPPGCRPGSDINVSGYEVATLGSTHLLAVNKFPAARSHLLILTQDGFRRQHEALDLDDLTAARQVLASLESRHLLLFNCGIDSGCSRMHKHMHAFPAPDPEKFALWPDDANSEHVKPSFKFFMHRFSDGLPPPDALLGIYRGLVRRAERAAGYIAREGERAAVAHNVILDRSWLLVVPRRAAGWDGVDTNAAGMLGMVWVHSEEKMKLWLERGPANVLARLGIPADGN